jgi:CheY-like chemotaxis protein
VRRPIVRGRATSGAEVGRASGSTGGVDHPARPAAADPARRDATTGAGADRPDIRGFVLVVDDEKDVRESIAAVLQTNGFAVTAACDGRDALAVLELLRVDVIVLDMRMPHLGGAALLELVEDPPVAVVVSADPVDAGLRRRLGSKVHDYLAKPFDPRALVAAVAAATGAGAG